MTAIGIRRGPWLPAIRQLADDEAVAAIGDVHGQDDLFAALLDALAEELGAAERRTIVQLGDLVDRGPGSISALRRVRRGLPGADLVAIKGNHEDRMLKAVLTDDPTERELWLAYGGADTLAEVGVDADRAGWRDAFVAAVGEDMMLWVASLPTMRRVGGLIFVHAGLDPAAALDAQSPHTLMWTRRPWLESAGPYAEDVAVAHGHTPTRAVALDHPHRVNLDTGAFQSGVLSALVVTGARMRLVQAMR